MLPNQILTIANPEKKIGCFYGEWCGLFYDRRKLI